MDSEKSNQESKIRGKSTQSTIKSSKPPAVLNNDCLIGELVRRSPRAPPRVKTNFNDVFSKDSGTKKPVTESMTQSSDASEGSAVPANFPGSIDTADGRKVDAHCWLCHRANPNQEPEDLSYCVKCVRVFHFECLGGTQRFSEDGLCPECKITSLDGTKLHDSLTPERLAKLLTYALNTMMKNAQQLKKFNYSEKQSQDLVYPVDLAKLLKNIEQQHYESTAAFLSDVKWILHNLMILPGVNRVLISNAKKLVTECKAEMLDIEACPDCYAHMHSLKDNWFSKLCNVNHTLVWVKIKGFPYWPAKVLKVVDGVADVRFFGTHEKALVKVPGENCFWLSQESPNHKMPQHSLFKVALEELEVYTKSVQKGYGAIEYHPLETKYDPVSQNICTKQVNRKREHSNSGPQSKPKRQKTAPVLIKDLRVELSKEVTAKVTSTPQVLNGSKETASVMSPIKGATNSPEKQVPSKKGTVVGNPKDTVSDKSSKSVKTVKTGALGQGVHKNATKHNRLSIASTSVSKKHSGSPGKLPSPRGVSTVSPTKQSANSKCGCAERTKPKTPEKPTYQLSSETGVPRDSSSSSNNEFGGSHSVTEVNGCHGTIQHVENSETGDQDVTMLEAASGNSESPFVSEQVSADSSSVSVEENMPSNTNSEEPAFVSSTEVPNPANMLEFYEEESDNQNDFSYEPVTTPTYGYSRDNAESTHIQRPQPFSVEVPSNENMEPNMIPPQPCPHCVLVPVPEYPQEDRYVCTMPLPEELNVEKYQNMVNTTIRATVEEIWHDYVNSQNVRNLLFQAQQEKEDMELRYKKEAEEVAKNTNLIISTMERKHAEALEALRRKCEKEKEEAIKELKKKLLCQHCGKEAKFTCCGDDSCCDHPCQKAHWLLEEMASSSSSSAHANFTGNPQSPDSSMCSTRKTWNEEQPRTHSGVISNKGQAPSTSQCTASSRHFARPLLGPPPLVPRPPEALVNRASSVPPDSSLFVQGV